jgi:hypothetical protein
VASLKEQLAAAEARIAELEAQLQEAEVALGHAPATPAAPDRTGEAVWMRDPAGREWNVEVGSTAYEQLLARSAVEFTPDGDDSAE